MPLILVFVLSQVKLPWKFSEDLIAYDVIEESPNFDYENFYQIISKPLKYLGNGRQAIAFATDDGKYVLKFLTIKPIKDQKLFSRSKNCACRRLKREKSVKRVMKNYIRVFQTLKNETGLIALHFNPTEKKLGSCEIIDRNGNRSRIDLDRAPFIFQHRGEPLTTVFSNKMSEEYRTLHQSFENFLERRARLGFTDLNRGFNIDNYAFIGSQPAMIDPGNVIYSELQKQNPESEIQRIHALFHQRFSPQVD